MFAVHSPVNRWACRHMVVPMSGDAGTLAGRIANCTAQADREYPWYSLKYLGNGIGIGVDHKMAPRHACIEAGLNSPTQDWTGYWMAGPTGDTSSGSISAAITTPKVNSADGDMRLGLVDNPFRVGGQCWLHRVRSGDGDGDIYRSNLRLAGGTPSTPRDMRQADCIPFNLEVYWAVALLYGDQAGWDGDGATESWANWSQDTQREVTGWQLHDDNCRRRFSIEPPCRLNIEPGVEADVETVGCG